MEKPFVDPRHQVEQTVVDTELSEFEVFERIEELEKTAVGEHHEVEELVRIEKTDEHLSEAHAMPVERVADSDVEELVEFEVEETV